MRVGIIDCGTNTVRLLIADVMGDALTDVVRTLRFTRLGQGVDATHRFHPDALARTFAALDEYAAMIAAHGPLDRLRFLATSAARDAANRDEFVAGVVARLGVEPEVITGDEEARLSFRGALLGLGAVGRVLVMDIGGGSTELILGDGAGGVGVAHSFDIGSVRLRERVLGGDPPTPGQIDQARELVAGMLADGPVPLRAGMVDAVIGVAGTNTSLSAMNMGLQVYDATRVDRSTLLPDQIKALTDHLLASPISSVRQEYPILEPLRAEVICAGALICDMVAAKVGIPMLVRETDILDGAALVAQR